MPRLGSLVLISVVVLLFTAACQRRTARDGAAFFAGKTITYIVSTRAGGGYDMYARTIMRYMAPHIPGVRIVVVNAPGAANIVGANQIYEAAPDGLTMGTFTMGLMFSQLTAAPGPVTSGQLVYPSYATVSGWLRKAETRLATTTGDCLRIAAPVFDVGRLLQSPRAKIFVYLL